MTLRSLSTTFLLALAAVPALLTAQIETSAKEDERMAALARDDDGWFSPRNKVSVGFRILSSGAKVNFSNLGSVPASYDIIPASVGVANRTYVDGKVSLDTVRAGERDANGNQTSTPGERYVTTATTTDGSTVTTGSYLSYTPGMTRSWEAEAAYQLETPGYVAFNIYSATSDGGTASKKQGPTGGIELQFSRELGRGARNFQWSLMAGVSLTDINSKTAGSVSSTLNTYTDYYSLNGQTVLGDRLTNPSYGELEITENGVKHKIEFETTVPIGAVPDPSLSTNVSVPGGATVNGRWQVKGAYFLVKFGPSVRTQITERLGVSASVGLAGGYAGTRYSTSEAFSLEKLPDVVLQTFDPESGSNVIGSTTQKFLTGYYADVNLEWTASDTLGLFGGFTAQQLSDYEQELEGRRAKIDLGNAVGIRGGVSIKF